MDQNILKKLGRPNIRYAKSLVQFELDLAVLWIHEKTRRTINKRSQKGQQICKLGAHFHVLVMYVRLCITLYVINKLRRLNLTYAEYFVKFY